MFFLDTANTGIGYDILRSLCMWLCETIYSLIAFIYRLLMTFANINLMNTKEASEFISTLYSRVEILLIIFMLFIVVFNLIKMLIDPELMTNKEQGLSNIAKRAVISVALLALVPYAFDIAFEVQDKILKGNVIEKVILGTEAQEIETDNFGNEFAADIFTMFYKVNPEFEGDKSVCDGMTTEDIHDYISIYGKMNAASGCLNDTTGSVFTGSKSYVIDFDGISAVICGIFILVMALSYTISLAIRMFQLAFLQVIAPVPIMTYIIPKKDGTFSKWLKACVTTYIDVFIRLSILYFSVVVISLILDETFKLDDSLGIWGKLILLCGIVAFCNRAPKLIQELFPSSGGAASLGFGFQGLKDAKPAISGMGRVAGGTVGAVGGAGISAISRYRAQKARNIDENGKWRTDETGKSLRGKAIRAAVGGIGSGLVTGGIHSSKKGNVFKNIGSGVNAVRQKDENYEALINKGGSIPGVWLSRVQDTIGESRGKIDKRKIDNAAHFSELVDQIETKAESSSFYKGLKRDYEMLQQLDGESRDQFEIRRKAHYDRMENYKAAFIDAALAGKETFDYSYTSVEYQRDSKGNYIRDHQGRLKPIIKEDVAAPTVTMGASERTKAAEIKATHAELESDVIAKNTVFYVEAKDKDGKVIIGEDGKPKLIETSVGDVGTNWEMLSTQSKKAKQTGANIRRAPGYQAGQANYEASSKK